MEKLKKQFKEPFERFEMQKQQIRRLWNIDPECAQLLHFLVDIKAPKHILEIGTSNGYSAFMMSLACQDTNCLLETIEVDEKRYQMAEENLSGMTQIKQYLGKAEDVIPRLTNLYDFVFIDANKPAYIQYIQLIIPFLHDKAVIVADNVSSHPETTKAYQDFIMNDLRFKSMLLNHEAGLMISIFSKK
ncbi:MAG TPA: class I SAM-dependent methyltransferase [Candidatus Cloacimonadota bacterium]|nr:class I SAM-dependent methyltransferase [Candidatus Cloacimonadota bacterium]HPM03382.1 class I SAM-dependent methyltransferase [Candidatus Cloacimonadota bacterium]